MAKEKKQLPDYLKYTSMGFEILAYVLFAVFAGYKLDQWLGTDPWLLLVCSLLGVAGAMYHAVKKAS
ncbi:MAG: AtpZ/AtpI family protein [Bacteroidota bacterium]